MNFSRPVPGAAVVVVFIGKRLMGVITLPRRENPGGRQQRDIAVNLAVQL